MTMDWGLQRGRRRQVKTWRPAALQIGEAQGRLTPSPLRPLLGVRHGPCGAARAEDAPSARGREEDLSTSTKAGSREALVGGRRRHRRPPSKAEVDGSDEGGATPPIEATFTFIFSSSCFIAAISLSFNSLLSLFRWGGSEREMRHAAIKDFYSYVYHTGVRHERKCRCASV